MIITFKNLWLILKFFFLLNFESGCNHHSCNVVILAPISLKEEMSMFNFDTFSSDDYIQKEKLSFNSGMYVRHCIICVIYFLFRWCADSNKNDKKDSLQLLYQLYHSIYTSHKVWGHCIILNYIYQILQFSLNDFEIKMSMLSHILVILSVLCLYSCQSLIQWSIFAVKLGKYP